MDVIGRFQDMTPATQQRIVVGVSLAMIYLLGAWMKHTTTSNIFS